MVDRLLILCSRIHPSPEALSEVEDILDSELDWNELVQKAIEEKVVTLLFKSLKMLKERVPESKYELLKKYYKNNSIRNVRNFLKLSPLFRAFNNGRLQISLIKGARLAETLYKDWGLRRFDDYDFLVHPEEIRALHKILVKQDLWTDLHTCFAPENRLDKIRSIMQHGFLKDNVRIDFRFDYPGLGIPIDTDNELWERTQKLTIHGVQVNVFSSEYEFCLLCLHAQGHAYQRLIWLTDIVEFTQSQELDWYRIQLICERLEIHAAVYHALWLVNSLWPKSVPQEIVDRFDPGNIRKRLLTLMWPVNRVVSRGFYRDPVFHAPAIFLFISPRRFFLKLRTLVGLTFPSQDFIAFRYKIPVNSTKMFIFYLRRLIKPITLIISLISGLARRM